MTAPSLTISTIENGALAGLIEIGSADVQSDVPFYVRGVAAEQRQRQSAAAAHIQHTRVRRALLSDDQVLQALRRDLHSGEGPEAG